MRATNLLLVSVLLAAPVGCRAQTVRILVIRQASVLDVTNGSVLPGSTIVVEDGRITEVTRDDVPIPNGAVVLDADGRLVTPGFIDVHHHIEYVLGDSITEGGSLITQLRDDPASLADYRRQFAAAYLPYGITSVRDVGSSEYDIELLRSWRERDSSFPDFLPSGSAFITYDPDYSPIPAYAVLRDPDGARAKVREYHERGIRHLKLYWRLREPEFAAALEEANRLDLAVTGHVDYRVLPFDRALDLGLRSFEHAYTVGVSAMTSEEWSAIWSTELPRHYGSRRDGLFFLAVPEYFHTLGPDNARVDRLIGRLAEVRAFLAPTLHIFAQRMGLTQFSSPSLGAFDRTDGLTQPQLDRIRAGYAILADYVRQMHERGVVLTVGTDWIDPGPAFLSELSLLHETGIEMTDVLRIATVNGATALAIDDETGTVEVGKRANLVIFDASPLDDPANIWAGKTVIKDGDVHASGR